MHGRCIFLVFSVVSDFATPLPTNLDRLEFVHYRLHLHSALFGSL